MERCERCDSPVGMRLGNSQHVLCTQHIQSTEMSLSADLKRGDWKWRPPVGALVVRLGATTLEEVSLLTDEELLKCGNLGKIHLRKIRAVAPYRQELPTEVARNWCPMCGGRGWLPVTLEHARAPW